MTKPKGRPCLPDPEGERAAGKIANRAKTRARMSARRLLTAQEDAKRDTVVDQLQQLSLFHTMWSPVISHFFATPQSMSTHLNRNPASAAAITPDTITTFRWSGTTRVGRSVLLSAAAADHTLPYDWASTTISAAIGSVNQKSEDDLSIIENADSAVGNVCDSIPISHSLTPNDVPLTAKQKSYRKQSEKRMHERAKERARREPPTKKQQQDSDANRKRRDKAKAAIEQRADKLASLQRDAPGCQSFSDSWSGAIGTLRQALHTHGSLGINLSLDDEYYEQPQPAVPLPKYVRVDVVGWPFTVKLDELAAHLPDPWSNEVYTQPRGAAVTYASDGYGALSGDTSESFGGGGY